MNKKLIIINGTMGIGKTAVCKQLNKTLKDSVWLDGDWCWMINPFTVNEENKNMVMNNITYMLKSFLNNSSLKYVIFNWVIHEESIFDSILEPLKDIEFDVIKITLTCSEETLKKRIQKDIKNGLRDEACLERSIKRLKMYGNMDTEKIDTDELSIEEIVQEITNKLK